MRISRLIISSIFLLPILLVAISYDLKHEINLSATEFRQTGYWRPDLNLTFFDNNSYTLDARFIPAINYISGSDDNFDYETFRFWGRISRENWFIRVGRQKINFGPATFLRPLQWFDTINPLDPLKQSFGIDAALARYYLGTANFWLWATEQQSLYQQDSTFKNDNLNYGLRIENSLTYCDAAVSANFRNTDSTGLESKLGIDARWDNILGYWVEASIVNYSDPQKLEWDKHLSLGADYTLGIGNGIYSIIEFMNHTESDNTILDSYSDFCYTALSLNYPVSILSNLNYSCLTNWKYEYNLYNLTMDFSTDYFRFIPYLSWSNSHENLIKSSSIDEVGFRAYLNF